MNYMKSRVLKFFIISFIFSTGCDQNDTRIVPSISFGNTSGMSIAESSVASSRIIIRSNVSINEPIKVAFELTGDATLNEDFTMSKDFFEISPGELTDEILIRTIDESLDEPFENFTIKLTDVPTENANIADINNEYLTEIRDDDNSDLEISLRWTEGYYSESTTVDMDLYLWREDNSNPNGYELIDYSTARGSTYTTGILPNQENIILSGIEVDGKYAVSCVLHSTDYDSINFKLGYYPTEFATVYSERFNYVEFEAKYSVSNLNQSQDSSSFHLVHFFEKDNFNFLNFTNIEVPENGS